MIKRHHTADCVNLVINDPSVYDWVRGNFDGKIDVSQTVADPQNVLLMGEHGGVIFLKHQPGIYEAHTQVLPAGRGTWAKDMVNEAVHWMFCNTDAMDIMTRVPHGNYAARALTKTIKGGSLEFHIERGWYKDGKVIPADIYSIRLQDWMAHTPGLEERGHWFHERLTEEYKRLGHEEAIHADDPVHDRYVGATVDMIMGGQTEKAVVFYNRWAGMAGYLPFGIASLDPLVIDIQEALLEIRGDTFWVLRVK